MGPKLVGYIKSSLSLSGIWQCCAPPPPPSCTVSSLFVLQVGLTPVILSTVHFVAVHFSKHGSLIVKKGWTDICKFMHSLYKMDSQDTLCRVHEIVFMKGKQLHRSCQSNNSSEWRWICLIHSCSVQARKILREIHCDYFSVLLMECFVHCDW